MTTGQDEPSEETGASGADRAIASAAEILSAHAPTPPRVAVVLGTGLHSFANAIDSDAVVDFESLSGLSPATADGHAGKFILGHWNGIPLVAASGRLHLYEAHPIDRVIRPVQILAALGIRHLILSNAAGGLHSGFRPGDAMIIEDQLDFTFAKAGRPASQSIPDKRALLRPSAAPSEIYSRTWIDRCTTALSRRGLRVARGVYLGLTGPNYETRAEYRWMRAVGADAVGMSTVWEAKTAVELGMEVFGLSVITNVANPDCPSATTSEDVQSTAGQADAVVHAVVEQAIESILP